MTPEFVLLAFGLLLLFGVMWKTSTGACHTWKDRLGRVSGAYLAAAGEREFPQPGEQTITQDRDALHRATSKVLDERPFGCF